MWYTATSHAERGLDSVYNEMFNFQWLGDLHQHHYVAHTWAVLYLSGSYDMTE